MKHVANEQSDSSVSSGTSDDEYQVCYVIHTMQVNALRHLEQHFELCDSKGHEAHTCNIIINYILAQAVVRKDPLPHDCIIKSFKYF